jgi:hypothetical protein
MAPRWVHVIGESMVENADAVERQRMMMSSIFWVNKAQLFIALCPRITMMSMNM